MDFSSSPIKRLGTFQAKHLTCPHLVCPYSRIVVPAKDFFQHAKMDGGLGSINDRWGQNDESQDQCSSAGKLQAAGKLQVCSRITFASKTTRATELQVWEGITGWRKSQAAGKSLRVGKCMSGRKLRSQRKCRSGSEFQVRGYYSFAGNLQKCAKRRKVPGQSVVRLTLVLQSRADAMMQGTDGSTLEKSEVRALMRSIV